ncbi:hypothetical protein Barb6_03623 [Bacteroidales bacterium Barb6]|nr:hypothetical protein Barb6_03623 [Bacteroidales bacterium Barb6]
MVGADLVFHTCQHTQFAFYGHIMLMSIFNDLLRQSHIFIVGKMRTVNHYGREPQVHTTLAQLKRIAVIQVENNLRMLATQLFGIRHGTFRHITEQRLVGIFAGTAGHLQNHRRVRFRRCLNDSLHLLHVVEIERRNGILAFHSLLKHLPCVHKA